MQTHPTAPLRTIRLFDIVSTHETVADALENSTIDLDWLQEAANEAARTLDREDTGRPVREVFVVTNRQTGDVEILALQYDYNLGFHHLVDLVAMAKAEPVDPFLMVISRQNKVILETSTPLLSRNHGQIVAVQHDEDQACEFAFSA